MKQKLSLFDFTMIVVGLVIGMGIFRTASTSAKAANDPTIFFAAWIIGGVIALCGALTYGEIGSAFPESGGEYNYLSKLYHPAIGFMSGFVSSTTSFLPAPFIVFSFFTLIFSNEHCPLFLACCQGR